MRPLPAIILTVFISACSDNNSASDEIVSEKIEDITLNWIGCADCLTIETERFRLRFDKADFQASLTESLPAADGSVFSLVDNESTIDFASDTNLNQHYPSIESVAYDLLVDGQGEVFSRNLNKNVTTLYRFKVDQTYGESEYLFVPNDTTLFWVATVSGL